MNWRKLGDYELIHVDRLVRDGEKIHSALNFVPPTVALAGSSNLTRMLRDVRDEIVGRSKQLEEYKSPREMQKSEFDASYMTFLLALRSLNRYGPRLFHLIDNQLTHPWHVYGVLREIVGELSSFSDRHSMTGETSMGGDGLPSYDHGNIGRCVHASLILIRQLLNEITIGPELIVQLLPDGDFLAAELPRRFVDAKNECYFVLRTEEDPESVVRSFQSEAKVASRQELPNLINRSLPGVEVTHLPLAPQGLPRRSFSLYFGLSKSNDQWSDVERSANIALYWANAPADLKIELVVLRN
jgi:type VI secretion system protein ImpJ